MQRAIETRYKQRLFRSRLEARYAVLFDELKIKWDYEPEGFDLGGGLRYLPDFFLHLPSERHPGSGYWVEIKGKEPSGEEKRKFDLLCKQTGHSGYIFTGSPGEGRVFRCDWGSHPSREHVRELVEEPHYYAGETPQRHALRWRCAAMALCHNLKPGAYASGFDRAVERALSARFEFGARA